MFGVYLKTVGFTLYVLRPLWLKLQRRQVRTARHSPIRSLLSGLEQYPCRGGACARAVFACRDKEPVSPGRLEAVTHTLQDFHRLSLRACRPPVKVRS
eukprot:14946979-Alexandrium_andersonii.AAC.1